ncbi:cell division protein FtsK [Kutzneria viridogrisea]|uniref:S-DNA-T family DNA segregation ATPase FtsK/SpoIIIE n=1 Tax=Kutzneria viridogrisea TaxID=47990 RepID=A0ABR6BLC8_9PSEU|nr:S-DNA-T family DNA segregation ATPase FtsK/SpoIIIE [Kutzneria viridogrisea]
MRNTTRKLGTEARAITWTARHPGSILLPGAVVASAVVLGLPTTGGVLGGGLLGLGAWYRAHPGSFDALVAPRMRAWKRRWWSRYTGSRWRDTLIACDLVATNRQTGELRVPRILRVQSPSPSIDLVRVRLHPGQHARQWEDRLPELADALRVERVAVERVRPQVIALVVERSEPFTEVIPAPDMPWDVDAVDLGGLYLGDTEYGTDWCEALLGQHLLVAGASGSGKGSLAWGPLRGLAPLIRDGIVRPWVLDPKRMELAKAEAFAYRYAAETADCLEVAREFVADCEQTQRTLAAQGKRKFTPSRETPLNLLLIDEIAALTGFADMAVAREFRKLLNVVGTQGRATGHSMLGYVQEPTKDNISMRDLFTVRICLRVTSAGHVDMVLGDGARQRGALADEIPNSADTAGIGYVIRQRSRVPMRVRAAYVTDPEIDELIAFVTGSNLRVVA